jgi:hypothetical protein
VENILKSDRVLGRYRTKGQLPFNGAATYSDFNQ